MTSSPIFIRRPFKQHACRHDKCTRERLFGRPPTAMRMMMAVVIIVVMMVIVIMIMTVRMIMSMAMRVVMIIIVMVQPLARAGPARILAEDERLDGHRHREGRIADAAEID